MRTVTVIGQASGGAPLTALLADDDGGYAVDRPRVLLIGRSEAALARIVASLAAGSPPRSGRWLLAAVCDPVPGASYPPPGEAYAGAREAHTLWRWTGMHAPDLVLVEGMAARPDDLGTQLQRVAPAGIGTMPVVRLESFTEAGIAAVLARWDGRASPARTEIRRRLARTPGEVAHQLGARYATALEQPVYIPAMALVGRIRLGEVDAVEAIAAPYLDGRKPALADLTSSHFGGHLLFCELAAATGRAAWLDLARAAADLAFDDGGRPREAMPLHDEMSDSLFLVCPLLARVASMTGDARYRDMCARHLRFIRRLTVRPDGLYRHSPLNDAAWGRGNGFAALGLALTLDALPAADPLHGEAKAALVTLLHALLANQDADGMWHQVIDVPASYRELSATCMIAAAIARGVRRGWLPGAPFGAALARAWYGIRARIGFDGALVDVCTGTGKQASLRAYLDRPALLGIDARGGAMGLLVATELMANSNPT
jgi:rhamnogalacturonyl hydrolase YesR